MSQKILPYKIPKMMLTYPYNAFYFGILEANNIDYDNIILMIFWNYIILKNAKYIKLILEIAACLNLIDLSQLSFLKQITL